MAKPIRQDTRDLINAHLSDPQAVTQAEVMRKLKITSHNNFYRLVYQAVRNNK